MTRLAIVPARGGSKRIPGKNIRPFAGTPMIGHAIKTARDAGLFDAVIVSTDSERIADVARDFGAATPFLRPPELADDHTGTLPVIAHAITEMSNRGMKAEWVCCIYPCTPFLEATDLQGGLESLLGAQSAYAMSVCQFPSPPQRALRMEHDGRLRSLDSSNESARTQDLEPAYFDAGQFYWGHASAWCMATPIHQNAVGVPVHWTRAIDIDTEEDWLKAEAIHRVFGPEMRRS